MTVDFSLLSLSLEVDKKVFADDGVGDDGVGVDAGDDAKEVANGNPQDQERSKGDIESRSLPGLLLQASKNPPRAYLTTLDQV